jgi:rubrerythrin
MKHTVEVKDLFEEFFGLGSIDIAEGVEIAIDLEKKSIEYYTDKSKKTKSKDVANLLKFIAKEEATHLKQLETLKQSIAKKKGWVSADKLGKPGGPKLYAKVKLPTISDESGDVGILLGAARAEREAKNFYEDFSRTIKDEKGRMFFQKLAEFEQTHYDLFDGILKASEVRVESTGIL